MKAKSFVILVTTVGCLVVTGLWAWLLSGDLNGGGIGVGLAVTGVLGLISAALAKAKMRAEGESSASGAISTIRLLGFLPLVMGAFVVIFERVPSRYGPSTPLDRRYALLFFGLFVYVIIFTVLASRSRKP